METTKITAGGAARRRPVYAFHLTPAEWHALLADQSFLRDPDNSFSPRRLMGVPVEIIPDHRFIVACSTRRPFSPPPGKSVGNAPCQPGNSGETYL